MTLKEMRQRLGELVEQQRRVVDESRAAGRKSLTSDEEQRFDALDKDIDAAEAEIAREEKMAAREKELSQPANPAAVRAVVGELAGKAGAIEARAILDAMPERTRRRWEMAGYGHELREHFQRRASEQYRAEFRAYLTGGKDALFAIEKRAMQQDNDYIGGSLVAPVQFVNELIKFIDDSVYIRQLATVTPLASAKSLGKPTWDTDPADPDWTAEIGSGTEDSSAATGLREFTPHPLAKRIKVSEKLIRSTGGGAEQLVVQRLGYKNAIAQEKAFMTGTGAAQPLGVFTASVSGISTGRDTVTGSTTDLTADGLINIFYALKEGYQRNATWVVSRGFIQRARKLKGSDNNYLWQPGLSDNVPANILGRPYVMSEYVPNTWTTGLYVGIVGDFSFYHIAEALDIRVQRLAELYAESNQVGFISRSEVDGMPVLEEAFSRAKTS